tara:strand:+ start:284 stop:454 length:171 start_codon:yes stop_codon:yes gene_type:complete
MKEQKTNLAKAYKKLRKLNIEMSTEDFIELSNIMCNLANQQFESGLNAGEEIFKTK